MSRDWDHPRPSKIACDPKYLYEPKVEPEPKSFMDAFHKVFSGNPDSRKLLIGASLFALFWFAIDVHQYGDFLWQKLYPTKPVCEISLPRLPSLPNGFNLPLTQNNDGRLGGQGISPQDAPRR